MEIHKNFLCLITDEKYYNTPTVDMSLFDLTNNPHEIEKGHLREAHKRDKEIDDICINNDHVHLQHLQVSKESLDEIQGQPPWLKLEVSKDPLQLWVMIKKSHQVLTTSKVATREEYSSCWQEQYKNIVDCKCRFDAWLIAYVASGNGSPPKEDITMDFLYGLDNTKYAKFKAEIINDRQNGVMTQPGDLNTM